jgi:hypothetical protein
MVVHGPQKFPRRFPGVSGALDNTIPMHTITGLDQLHSAGMDKRIWAHG